MAGRLFCATHPRTRPVRLGGKSGSERLRCPKCLAAASARSFARWYARHDFDGESWEAYAARKGHASPELRHETELEAVYRASCIYVPAPGALNPRIIFNA